MIQAIALALFVTATAYLIALKNKEIINLKIKIFELEEADIIQKITYSTELEQFKADSEEEKLNQLHELALMLDNSYMIEDQTYKKAKIHDYLLHHSNLDTPTNELVGFLGSRNFY